MFGLGAGIFTFLASEYCNPAGINPDIIANNGKPFSFEVGQNVPKSLVKLGYWYIGMMVISMLVMPNHLKKKDGKVPIMAAEGEKHEVVPDVDNLGFKEIFRNKEFW